MAIWSNLVGLVLAATGAFPALAADSQADARDAVVKYFAAVKASDWGAMYDLIAEESRGGQSREQFVTTREGGMGAELGKAIQARSTYQVGAVRIAEGGTSGEANVDVRMPDLRSGGGAMPTPDQIAQAPLHELQRTLQLVVEGGGWKVVRPKAVLSPEAAERLQKAARESIERAHPPGKSD